MVDAQAHYQEKLSQLQTRSARLLEQDNRFSQIRVAVFLVAAALLFFGYAVAPNRTPWTIMGWLGAFAFLVTITWHEYIRLQLWLNERRGDLYRRLSARLQRQWDALPLVDNRIADTEQGLVDDLDVTGKASLMHWLCFAETGPARQKLLRWLLDDPVVEDILRRQQAVLFFADDVELRERVYCLSAEVASGTASPERFVEWAASPPWLRSRPFLHWGSWIGCILIALSLLLMFINSTVQGPLTLEWTLGILVVGILWNVLLSVGYGSHLHEIFQRISSRHHDVEKYQELLALMTTRQTTHSSVEVPRLVAELRQRVRDEGDADVALSSLRWRIGLASMRHSPLFFIPYLALQILVAWDFRSIEVLERWQSRYGRHTRGWFEALAEFEALCAVAAVRFEHPEWCMPEIRYDRAMRVTATALGHPLLRNSHRVTNDLAILDDRPLWLITGSNMSGKSTFLRALGSNILLARTGAPVCAAAMSMPPLILATSIRIRDSLDQGVSYFMAELKRLRCVVDIAEHYRESTTYRVLFLLDEIMQGTNSRERHIAVGHVLDTLLAKGAFGAVSTHDLDLVNHPLLEPKCEVVHFREHIEQIGNERRMIFDYKMRHGPTPTTNALRLLALVGLGDLTDDKR